MGTCVTTPIIWTLLEPPFLPISSNLQREREGQRKREGEKKRGRKREREREREHKR